jgi:hypothetical protein
VLRPFTSDFFASVEGCTPKQDLRKAPRFVCRCLSYAPAHAEGPRDGGCACVHARRPRTDSGRWRVLRACRAALMPPAHFNCFFHTTSLSAPVCTSAALGPPAALALWRCRRLTVTRTLRHPPAPHTITHSHMAMARCRNAGPCRPPLACFSTAGAAPAAFKSAAKASRGPRVWWQLLNPLWVPCNGALSHTLALVPRRIMGGARVRTGAVPPAGGGGLAATANTSAAAPRRDCQS